MNIEEEILEALSRDVSTVMADPWCRCECHVPGTFATHLRACCGTPSMWRPRKDRMGRVVTWPEGTMRPLALHESPPSLWRRLHPASPCPEPDRSGTACGAFLSVQWDTDRYLCAAGHVVTAERMYRLIGGRP